MAGTFGKGATLTLGTAVAQLTNISGPSESADTHDTSSHDTADLYRTFVGGWIDGGEVSVEGNVKDKTQMDIFHDKLGELTTGATITLPLAKVVTVTFDCIVTAFEQSAPHDDLMTFSATLKVSGEPVITEAA